MRGAFWCATAFLACAPHAAPGRAVSGDSSVELLADVALPYRLLSAVVLVDGEVVARHPGRLSLPLSPGEHELAIAAKVSRPCDLLAEQREHSRVRAVKLFAVSERPVAIDARIVAGVVTAPQLEVTVDGARVETSVAELGCCQLELIEPVAAAPPGCHAPPDAGILVTGEVRHPRELRWERGMTAYDAIAAAGGATRLANLRYTTVKRRCGEVVELPWYASLTALLLMPGDDVTVRMTPDP